ncbi:MAG: family 20 glycosylhydrolase [Verrucomicrobia bacterium]|nr:family 20 glycosylhydrolase [Verrucomicrobiota bacterium]
MKAASRTAPVPAALRFALLGFGWLLAPVAGATPLGLLPTPKQLEVTGGTMPLTPRSRIVATDPSLEPVETLLAGEIERIAGLNLQTANGGGGAGDIVLKLNPQLRADEDILAVQRQKIGPTRDFAHAITVSDRAVVEGWDYRAVCEGTATLLQALGGQQGQLQLPRMKVKDWPHADYTGVMVDVARQRIPLDAVKAVVEACRLWKIRYCQLHLTDDEGFTFPSKAFPKLGTKNVAMHNGTIPEVYNLAELRDLVAFADARGVTLVPELETPGHSGAMCRSMPEVFAGPKVMNIINDEMYKALDTLIGEMCEVFKSSPYFHLGGDENYLYELEELPATAEYLKQHGLKNVNDVVMQHVKRMNDSIRKRGKLTLAWEGTPMDSPAMKDQVVLMAWIPWPTAEEHQKQGFATITVPWDLGVPLPEWNPSICNGCRLPPTSRILGAAQTMWHMSASALVGDFLGGDVEGSSCEGYLRSLADRTERTWGPKTGIQADEFQKRTTTARALLDKLVLPVRIETKDPTAMSWPVLGRKRFRDAVEIRLSAASPAGGEIRYTTDGTEPTSASPVYSRPFTAAESTAVHAALFNQGQQVGHISRDCFELIESGGMIENWLAAGPYSVEGKKATELFDVAFEPEQDGKVAWRPYRGGVVKFGDIPGFAGSQRVAYLRTQVWSPKAQPARLSVASDDGVKVFLNGKLVHGANLIRPAFTPDVLNVSLAQGWNLLLLKVTNGDEGWEAWVKLQDVDGNKLEKVRFKAE